MTSRTRVKRWTPPLSEAFRLAWRPMLAYTLFTAFGTIALVLTTAAYETSSKGNLIGWLGLFVGFIGIILGQLVALLRLRALPVMILTGICVALAAYVISTSRSSDAEYITVPLVFFCFAFPCGLLALMHRYELFASFWPAVGWIGSVFVILNREHRVHVWEQEKVRAWLPLPLVFLGGFLVFWLFYLAAKQAARVEMWQALSGAAARRVAKKERKVAALPRRNIVPILVATLLLFGVTAVLAPYLWRTGKGNRDGGGKIEQRQEERKTPDLDVEGVIKKMKELAESAKDALPKLWPLLLLLLLYRPAKRALLLTHLQAPVVPTPPSERIDNLWEYIRIAAEDAGVVPTSADSVEQLLRRIEATGGASPALAKASEIYVRTRYGFVVQRGDAVAMRAHAIEAAASIRKDLGAARRVKNLFRPLS